MRHLRVCSHFWAGPSPTKEHKFSWKCRSGIGHSWVSADRKERDREHWKYAEQFEIMGKRGCPGKEWGERRVAFRLKCVSFLDCPWFPFMYLGWSRVVPVASGWNFYNGIVGEHLYTSWLSRRKLDSQEEDVLSLLIHQPYASFAGLSTWEIRWAI